MSDPAAHQTPLNRHAPPEIPDFDLIREIGQGGFGRVWLARNRATGRLRALKLVPRSRGGAADPAGREVVSLARLETNLRRHHPNLLSVDHVGQTAECLFYVMDLADDAAADDAAGTAGAEPSAYQPATLRRRLGAGPLPAAECLACARQLLAGLASLHEAGMVHRDVKPANCLFVGGELKLADFGLLAQSSPQVSRVGTEKYMPPDGRMDAGADVYAAGLVVYEMITGFPAERFPQLGRGAQAIAADPILCALMWLALNACQPDPRDRFRDAAQMLAALEKKLSESPRPARLRRWTAAVLAGIAVAGAAVAGYWWLTPAHVCVNFISHPFGATILLDGEPLAGPGGEPAQTPCTIEDLPARTHRVVFRHPQRPDLDAGPVDFRATRQVVARWDSTLPEPATTDDGE